MTLPSELSQRTLPALSARGVPVSSARVLECSGITQADDAGVVFLLLARQRGVELKGLSAELSQRLSACEAVLKAIPPEAAEAKSAPSVRGWVEDIGEHTCEVASVWALSWSYLGEVLWNFAHPFAGRFRWEDFRRTFYQCGVQAVPVVMLIGFLLGLILAFQSAIPLKMFGGEGFVGGMVGLALVRELGLIITAILVAGRTGSAFAAEIGTMKVNEEIDALETMGLHPVRFLALPRILAGTLALPFLTLFAILAGLIGGWFVVKILGFSLHYYIGQLQTFVALGDLIGCLVKSIVFGFAVSLVGCWHGLRAGQDAGAVGSATTAAVVNGIILLAVLEGVFSVIFYAMGW